MKQAVFDLPSFLDVRRRSVISQARDESRKAADGDAYLSSASAYLALVSTRLLADMARDFERQLGELLVYIEKRASAGASSTADMARVKARSQAATSSRLEQESACGCIGDACTLNESLAYTPLDLDALDAPGLPTPPPLEEIRDTLAALADRLYRDHPDAALAALRGE